MNIIFQNLAVLSNIIGLLVCVASFQRNGFNSRRMSLKMTDEQLSVMINGMPGPMALESAIVCLNRGYSVLPIGFTGRNQPKSITVKGESRSQEVVLVEGPGLSDNANEFLKEAKEKYPNLLIIDYTHPSAVLNNIKCYIENNCDFVMGTTGEDPEKVSTLFETGKNYAVIAPNMAKQIVAMQATLQTMASRFPSSFINYELTVTESHQSTKSDTSGTAKALVKYMSILNNDSNFSAENIQKIREVDEQLAFGVPEAYLKGHAFHTYRLTSADKSTIFELKHNVCGRRIYAEGTADAVAYLSQIRSGSPFKRLYTMIDVLESGNMS